MIGKIKENICNKIHILTQNREAKKLGFTRVFVTDEVVKKYKNTVKGNKDKSDEELVNEEAEDLQDEVYENMLNLGEQDWWTICFHRMRVEFLELIELDILRNGIDTDFRVAKDFLWNLKHPLDSCFGGQGGDFPLAKGTI